MPSHIDSRTGNWKGAVETNIRAVAADEALLAKSPEQGFYLLYMIHNRHLLTYAVMMVGRSKEAIFHANKIVERVPKAWIEEHPARADGYYAMPLAVYILFRMWDEILAMALEDALAYGEPPSWIQPVRHALGAALLGQKRFAEAEEVFRKDLIEKPHNGWGLWGLARALERQGKAKQAKEVQARFETAWEDADIELSSSCLCLPGV